MFDFEEAFKAATERGDVVQTLALIKSKVSSALRIAAARNRIPLVIELLKQGADVNAQNQHGDTALIWAALDGNLEMVGLLLSYGAKPNIQNKQGKTALFYATAKGHEECVALLLKKGAKNIAAPILFSQTSQVSQILADKSQITATVRSKL